jgi:hypothetical protein
VSPLPDTVEWYPCTGSAADDLAGQLQGGAQAFFKVHTAPAAPRKAAQPLLSACVPYVFVCPNASDLLSSLQTAALASSHRSAV